MVCRRCPHHVRHGSVAADKKNIVFTDVCGLKVKAIERAEEAREKGAGGGMADRKAGGAAKPAYNPLKSGKDTECINAPFSENFSFRECKVYFEVFKTVGSKNDVVPTKDIQYSDAFSVGSITDLELL